MGEQGKKILLVEDDLVDAELLQRALFKAHPDQFELVHVETFGDALARLDTASYDAILLDFSLPDSKGFETCQQICEAVPHVPVVVLTGHDDDRMALEAVRNGAQAYLAKDRLDGECLAQAIRNAIGFAQQNPS